MARKKILVVEDDADTRFAMNLRLKASGYDVVVAADGATAVLVAQRERPDLVLLDLGLPAGDGFQVMERLRALPRTVAIPILVLSARDPEAHRARALRAGAAGFLQKPADNDVLLAEIRELLADAPDAAEAEAAPPAAPAAAREGERAGAGAARRRLLVVEDDADALRALSLRLQRSGYETCSASDTTAALRAAQRERPDLILLDLGLPAGGGLVVLERLRGIPDLARIPVIVVSASDAAESRTRALALGARAFFHKPADNELLLQAIRKALPGD